MNIFFLTTTDKNEIFLISSLDYHKSTDPNSIPVKTVKLLKNNISQQLIDIFNIFLDRAISFNFENSKCCAYTPKTILTIQLMDQHLRFSLLKGMGRLPELAKNLLVLLSRKYSLPVDSSPTKSLFSLTIQ